MVRITKNRLFIITLLIIGILSVVAIYSSINPQNNDDYHGEEFGFIMEANTSDLGSYSIETEYLSTENFNKLESPELSLDSERCLNFRNFTGNIDFDQNKMTGSSEGFATCTLNGTIDLTINENITDLEEVSARDIDNTKDLSFEASELQLTALDEGYPDKQIQNQTMVEIKDYKGSVTLYPEKGISLGGNASIKLDEEKIEREVQY